MAQYSTDFSGYTPDVAPSDWTKRWVDNWSILRVIETAAAIGGKELELSLSSDGRCAVSWDAIDADAGRDEVEALFRIRSDPSLGTTHQGRGMRCMLRGSGAASSETGWTIGHQDTSTHRVARYASGSFLNVQEDAGFSVESGVYYWLRVQCHGDNQKTKIWAGAVDDEPATWRIETADTSVSGVGWAGMFMFDNRAHVYVDWFGVGTGGDPAPGPVSAVAWRWDGADLIPVSLHVGSEFGP